MAGRPTKMTPDVLAKLEYAWSIGCSDTEACVHADIVPSTLYRYCEANPDFSERKETLKDRPIFKAKAVIDKALDSNDVNTARWMVEKKEGKARQAVEHTGKDGEAIKHDNTFVVQFVGMDEDNEE